MLLLLVAALGVVQLSAGDFIADLEKLAGIERKSPFDSSAAGYDKHSDIYFYKDDRVAREFVRSNYMATQMTLAGQAPDLTGRAVDEAVNPFGVGQRTFKSFGVMKDRWDVKDTRDRGTQYFGLFHGKGRDLVVNKVRANLLRHLADALEDQLPLLDRTADDDADDYPDQVAHVQDQVRATIERVYQEVDSSIRNLMLDSDDSKSTATVVVVSPKHVITINVGAGAVIAYEDADESDQDETVLAEPDTEPTNVFGLKSSRKEQVIQPYVQFFQRTKRDFKFLLIETPSVASEMDAHSQTNVVKKAITNHKISAAREQEIYKSAVMNILDEIDRSLSLVHKILLHSDYSVMLVGLDTDYDNIF